MKICKIHAVISQNKTLEINVSEYEVSAESPNSYTVLIDSFRHVWPKNGMKQIKTKTQNMVTKDNAFVSFYTKCVDNELGVAQDQIKAHILNYANNLAKNAALLAIKIQESEQK